MTSSPVQGRSICPVAGRGRPCLLLISARFGPRSASRPGRSIRRLPTGRVRTSRRLI